MSQGSHRNFVQWTSQFVRSCWRASKVLARPLLSFTLWQCSLVVATVVLMKLSSSTTKSIQAWGSGWENLCVSWIVGGLLFSSPLMLLVVAGHSGPVRPRAVVQGWVTLLMIGVFVSTVFKPHADEIGILPGWFDYAAMPCFLGFLAIWKQFGPDGARRNPDRKDSLIHG